MLNYVTVSVLQSDYLEDYPMDYYSDYIISNLKIENNPLMEWKENKLFILWC